MSTAIPHHSAVTHDHGHGETEPAAIGLPNVKLCMWLFLVSEVMFFAGLIGSYIVIRFGTAGWPNPYDILAVRITAFNTFLLICSSVTMVKAFQWSDAGDRGRAKKYLLATILGGATFVGIQVYEYRHLLHAPSTALFHVVEHEMEKRGLHAGESESHAAAEASRIVLASTGLSQVEQQNEQLLRLHEVLATGRPKVKKAAPPSQQAPLREWDRRALEETIKLAALFPEDDPFRAKISKIGKHHNIYPEGFVPGRDNFTSTFYIMTGFHGFHVAGGVVALLVILAFYALGRAGTMAIEVVGLYWHFVDLVWIILFTIVYLM
ncbi:MAG: heme-copper oxidase subunit III [Phycisphaerales bacterium]|nr:heme-copper oxidase subunit III [Phycisphaerales bacterium]